MFVFNKNEWEKSIIIIDYCSILLISWVWANQCNRFPPGICGFPQPPRASRRGGAEIRRGVEIRRCWAENGHINLPLPYYPSFFTWMGFFDRMEQDWAAMWFLKNLVLFKRVGLAQKSILVHLKGLARYKSYKLFWPHHQWWRKNEAIVYSFMQLLFLHHWQKLN